MSGSSLEKLKEALAGVIRRPYTHALKRMEDLVDIIHSAPQPDGAVALIIHLLTVSALPMGDGEVNEAYPSFSEPAAHRAHDAFLKVWVRQGACKHFHEGLPVRQVAEKVLAELIMARETLGKPGEVVALMVSLGLPRHAPYIDATHKVAPITHEKVRDILVAEVALVAELGMLLNNAENRVGTVARWLSSVRCSEETRAALIIRAMTELITSSSTAETSEIIIGVPSGLASLLDSLRKKSEAPPEKT